jgi:hypothetical protein
MGGASNEVGGIVQSIKDPTTPVSRLLAHQSRGILYLSLLTSLSGNTIGNSSLAVSDTERRKRRGGRGERRDREKGRGV